MIVVIGSPAYASTPSGDGAAAGLAVEVAAAARARGAAVELVGKVGDDGAGDAVVLGLGRLGIGHAALLRDPARPTPVLTALGEAEADQGGDVAAGLEAVGGDVEEAAEPARPTRTLLPADPDARPAMDAGDVALALRYLAEAKVVVLAEPLPEAAVTAVVDGATFSGARIVALVPAGAAAPTLSGDATILEEPAEDDGSFARLVGQYAAALDAGKEPAAAFMDAVGASGWEPVAD